MKTIAKLICIVLVFTGCNQKPLEVFASNCGTIEKAQFATFKDSINNFQLDIPTNWAMVRPYGDYAFALFDNDSFKKDSIGRMMTVESYQLPPNKTFTKFLEETHLDTERAIEEAGETDVFIIESIQNFEWEGKQIQQSITVDSSIPNVLTTTSQIYVYDGTTVFIIAIGTRGSDIEDLNCKYSNSVKSIQSM